MPLIAHNGLPSYARLAGEQQIVIDSDRAKQQDIRELHIGLLNMMPDAALEATERQFLRLIGASNGIAQFYVHLFTVDGLQRDSDARAHIKRYYESYEQVKENGLDALIITGANITGADLTRERFYEPMIDVVDWARKHVTSTLCSCLASHAVWQHCHGIERQPLHKKLWGVFEHQTIARYHPLVSGVNTRFFAPHSRYNDVSRSQLESAGITVLTASDHAGVLLATSADGLRFVYVQGHPEYDTTSLAKEYKREVLNYQRGERSDYPPLPEFYLGNTAQSIVESHRKRVLAGNDSEMFPELELAPLLDNVWIDTGKAIISNWLGLVYQVTGSNRHMPFMDGVDPSNPLQLKTHFPKKILRS